MKLIPAQQLVNEVKEEINLLRQLDKFEFYKLHIKRIAQLLDSVRLSKETINNPLRCLVVKNMEGGMPNALRTHAEDEKLPQIESDGLRLTFDELERHGYDVGFVKEEPYEGAGFWNYFIVVRIPGLPEHGRYLDDIESIRENEHKQNSQDRAIT